LNRPQSDFPLEDVQREGSQIHQGHLQGEIASSDE
jgi:hypothetical protein